MHSIKLDDKTFKALNWLAKRRNAHPDTLAVEAIEEKVRVEARRALEQEAEAFKGMHSQLLLEIPGEYAAIYQEILVDHDRDIVGLLQRMDERFPGEPVLVREVQEEVEPVIHVRSPRIEYA
jgi:hypothetical protein